MHTYICDWVEDDMEYTVSFDCEDWNTAQQIADAKGWALIGQYMDEQVVELLLDGTAVH